MLPTDTLSRRQREVVHLVAIGLTNSEIALRMGIKQRTVKDHLKASAHRLGTQCRLDTALVAIVRGWVTLDEIAANIEPRMQRVAAANQEL